MRHTTTYHCPCGERVPVTYKSRRWPRARVIFEPMSWADLWAHLWSHGEQP